MSGAKVCDICGQSIKKLTKKEASNMAVDFIFKTITRTINDGTFLKPLKDHGINSENFQHHMDVLKPYIDEINNKLRKIKKGS